MDQRTLREHRALRAWLLTFHPEAAYEMSPEPTTEPPTRASVIPTGPARKRFPLATGLCDYFPDALAVVAEVSYVSNEQHNPGEPVHWSREKSADEADALLRHFLQRGGRDDDGLRHTAKLAWRALALLQKELEGEPR